jgi:Co/Zn/Cd efflux system component
LPIDDHHPCGFHRLEVLAVLSAHVVTEDQALTESLDLMMELNKCLLTFGIEHTTIQLECMADGQWWALPGQTIELIAK